MLGRRRIVWFALCLQLSAVFIAGGLHDHGAGDCCHDAATADASSCQALHAHAGCNHAVEAAEAGSPLAKHSRADGFQRPSAQGCGTEGCLACQFLSLSSITLPACQLTLEQPLNLDFAIAEFEVVLLAQHGAFSSRAPPQGELL